MESGFNSRCPSDEPQTGKEEFSVALCGPVVRMPFSTTEATEEHKS
jgi:hypothetical protein